MTDRKEYLKNYMKKYYYEHKDKFLQEHIICECGSVLRPKNMTYHKTSKKHLIAMKTIESNKILS